MTTLPPPSPEAVAAFNQARTLRARGRLEEAAAGYHRVLALAPRLPEAHNNLGNLLQDLNRPEEAEAAFRRAIALRPDYADAFYNLAAPLQRLGRPAEAEAVLRRALALAPTLAAAHLTLGLVLKDLDRLDEAEAAFRRALAIHPGYGEAGSNLGTLLLLRQRPGEAEAVLRQALATNPGLADAWLNLGNTLRGLARLDEAAACYRQALAVAPHHAVAHSNLLLTLNGLPGDPAVLAAEHRAWAARHAAFPAPPGHANPADPERLLRVGYVSPDLGQHAIAYFLEPVLDAHDRTGVTVVCYSDRVVEDAVSARLKARAALWRPTCRLSDEALAGQVRADGIDILVDLAGHTSHNRLSVFARRPAPVQVTWLGYPNTTGLAAIDYRLTDPIADPAGAEALHSETLARLSAGFLCYRPPAEAPAPAPPPCRANGFVTFGSFNNLSKLSAPTVAAWSRLLAGTPGTRLLLKARALADPAGRHAVLARFAAHGIAPERLDLVPWADSPAGHLGLYDRVDIALDPFPYNGTTTTCEALWMGVPVVTLAGDRHAARVGASLLARLGLPDLVAGDVAGYLARAAALAADPERLAAWRGGLRGCMAAAPLCDAARFTRTLEAAYRAMWRRWCAGRAP